MDLEKSTKKLIRDYEEQLKNQDEEHILKLTEIADQQ